MDGDGGKERSDDEDERQGNEKASSVDKDDEQEDDVRSHGAKADAYKTSERTPQEDETERYE